MYEATPNTIPGTITAWSKWALAQAGTLLDYYKQFLDWYGDLYVTDQPNVTIWDHVQLIFGNPLDQDLGNRAVTTFDVINITGGSIDPSWTDADFQAVDTQLAQLATTWMGHSGSSHQFIESKHYLKSFNDQFAAKPYPPSGPPAKTYVHGVAGAAGSTVMPAQVSMTVTERTAWPRHWGRNYWPFPNIGTVEADGHIDPAVVTAMAGATETAYNALHAANFHVVVPSIWAQKTYARVLTSVAAISVDDVFDIQRRRRLKHSKTVVTRPLAAATKPAAA